MKDNPNTQMARAQSMKCVVIAVAALALVFGLTTQASSANLEIRLSDVFGGATVSSFACLDNTVCDFNPALGAMTVQVGLFSGAILTANASGTPATAGTFDLAFDYRVDNPAASTNYLIIVGENNLIGSNLVWTGTLSGTQVQAGGGADTSDFALFANNNNVKFDRTPGLARELCGPDQFTQPAFAGPATCTTTPVSDADGFALNGGVELSNLLATGDPAQPSATGNALYQVALGPGPGPGPVPEPGTLLLLGTGLTAVGLWNGRKALRKLEN